MNRLFGVVIILVGLGSGVLFFNAGQKLNASGNTLAQLRSQAGNTIAEVYYEEMGQHGEAYALMSYAFGLGVVAIAFGLGATLISRRE
jgi:hypothetical protein